FRLFITIHVLQVASLFFCNITATTDVYILSLHDALPIFVVAGAVLVEDGVVAEHRIGLEHLVARVAGAGETPDVGVPVGEVVLVDRKSTRLNSSHVKISYAVFCLKKKRQDTLLSVREHTV